MIFMKKRFKVFIPETEWEESHRVLEATAEVKVGDPGVKYTEDRLIKEIDDVDGIIITSQHHVSKKVLEAANRLKAIVKYGSRPGMDNVDLDAATAKGIVVGYTPAANSDSVAEHAITLILALLKNLYVTSSQLKQGKWRDNSLLGYDLLGKTVGLVGLGSVGSKVAEKIKGFGVKLLVYDPYVSEEAAKRTGVRLVDLETLLKESDVITIHAALTESTVNLIGEKQFKLMRKSAFIVNTARGAIVSEKALTKALKERWIAGAGLDVFVEEPPEPDNPLLKMENVLVTPHTASFTYGAFQREAFMAAEEVLEILQGKKPKAVANPEVFSKRRAPKG